MTSEQDYTTQLDQLAERASTCIACKLAITRQNVVFGEGSTEAEVMFIGEGPGRTEDTTGRPFVGRAGQLLTQMIEKHLGMQRRDVYIANIVKCRPTVEMLGEKDRPPDDEEVAACHPYLLKQIALVSPKALVTLGAPASKFLLNTSTGITRLRGQWGYVQEIPTLPTYHPSYLLRNRDPQRMQEAEHDFLSVRNFLGL